MEQVVERLADTQARAAALSSGLQKQLKVRRVFDLPANGSLKIQKVKPSGSCMGDKHKHRVRILVDGKLVVDTNLPEYEYRMGTISCTCEIKLAPCGHTCERGMERLRKKQGI